MKITCSIVCAIGLGLIAGKGYGQERARATEEIKAKNALWNTAYNNRDSVDFYGLFDSTAIVTTAGARLVGMEQCKRLCRFLYKNRPDIQWHNAVAKIEISDDNENAYETGDWTESWTENNDAAKSEIKGKYWIMYIRRADQNWYVQSAVFTPLSCKGSYCDK